MRGRVQGRNTWGLLTLIKTLSRPPEVSRTPPSAFPAFLSQPFMVPRAHVCPHWTVCCCGSGITSAWAAGSPMDFYAILDQVIDLLRQRQRVTYRALQRQFDLDEDALNDLKDELLYAHPQVVDDEGRGLRWTGDTVSTPVQAPPSTPPAPQLVTPGDPPLRLRPRHSYHMPLRRNAANSRYCSVTWQTQPRSLANSTRRISARWYTPIKRPAPR